MVIVRKVVRHFKSFFKVLDLPALLWLAADIERDEATSHVVLNRHRRSPSFKKDRPVNATCVRTLVLINNGMANLWHFSHILAFRKISEISAINRKNVRGIRELFPVVTYRKKGITEIKLESHRRVLEIRIKHEAWKFVWPGPITEIACVNHILMQRVWRSSFTYLSILFCSVPSRSNSM